MKRDEKKSRKVARRKPRRRRCAHCGDSFAPAGRGRPPIYCKPACNQAAYRKRRDEHLIALGAPSRAFKADIDQLRLRRIAHEEAVKVLRMAFPDNAELARLAEEAELEAAFRKPSARRRRVS